MTETPYDRYSYPDEGEPNWNRDEGPENIWEQQEIEIAGEVEQYIDLPEPDPGAETDDGQRRTYLVTSRKTIYRDTGSEWEAVAGVGDETNPLPGTSHFERAQVHEEPEDATDVVRWTDLDGLEIGGGGNGGGVGGTATATADGEATSFTVDTNIDVDDEDTEITSVHITPRNEAASLDFDATLDGSEITVSYYGSAPDEGVELEWWWAATGNFSDGEENGSGSGGDFSGSHQDLADVEEDDHHTRYTASEAQTAVEGTVEADSLLGSGGTSGQVLQTNGETTSWGAVEGGNGGGGEPLRVYASDYDTLNSAIQANDDMDVIYVIVPVGVTTFDASFSVGEGQGIYIEGYGPQSVIESDGANRLFNQSSDETSSHVTFKNLTIDGSHVTTSGQFINVNGSIRNLHLDGVHIKNIDINDQGGNNGFIRVQEPVGEVIIENGNVDYTEDSLVNRSNNKYKVLHQTTAGLADRMLIRNNHHEGHLYNRSEHNIDYINGYDANVTQSCQFYSNTFYKWDQYCIFGRCYTDHASIQIMNNYSSLTNSGDQYRAGCPSGESMGSIQMIGNIHAGTGRTEDTNEKLEGDRSCVIEGGQPHHVVVSNNIAYDSLTPYSSPSCRYTEFSNNLTINCGSFASDGSRAMIIHSQGNYDVGYVMIRDNAFINEISNRHHDNMIRIREVTGDGGGWDAEAIIDGNVFAGYSESDPIDTEVNDLTVIGNNFDID